MNKDNAHWHVGRRDRLEGAPRYKFQDPQLQRLYDAGYDAQPEQDHEQQEEALREEFRVRLAKLRGTLCDNCKKRPRISGSPYCAICY